MQEERKKTGGNNGQKNVFAEHYDVTVTLTTKIKIVAP